MLCKREEGGNVKSSQDGKLNNIRPVNGLERYMIRRHNRRRPVTCEPPQVPCMTYLDALEDTPRGQRTKELLKRSKKVLLRIYARAFESPTRKLRLRDLKQIERRARRLRRNELVRRIGE